MIKSPTNHERHAFIAYVVCLFLLLSLAHASTTSAPTQAPTEAATTSAAQEQSVPEEDHRLVYILASVFSVVGAVIGGALCWAMVHSQDGMMRRIVQRLPLVTPATLQDYEGEAVTLLGRVAHNGKALSAPFSGKQCVFYSVTLDETVWVQRSRALTEGEKVRVAAEQNGVDFLLVDTDDKGAVRAVLVPGWQKECSKAFTMLVQEHQVPIAPQPAGGPVAQKEGGSNLPFRTRDFLARNQLPVSSRRKFEYAEGLVETNELLAVCGVVVKIDTTKGPGTGWMLCPISREAIDHANWGCLARRAMRSCEGTLLMTTDHAIIGRQLDKTLALNPDSALDPLLSLCSAKPDRSFRRSNTQNVGPYWLPQSLPPPPYRVEPKGPLPFGPPGSQQAGSLKASTGKFRPSGVVVGSPASGTSEKRMGVGAVAAGGNASDSTFVNSQQGQREASDRDGSSDDLV